MELKSWDEYVAEAKREPLTLALNGTKKLTIPMPTKSAIDDLNQAMLLGDEPAALAALLGKDNAQTLLKMAADKPATVLTKLVDDITEHFGLQRMGKL